MKYLISKQLAIQTGMCKTFLIGLFISILIFANSAYATFGDITLTPPKIVNLSGKEMNVIKVDSPIGFSSILTNHALSERKFTYIVQILSKERGTEYLEGLSASIYPGQSFTASQYWIPKEAGQYTVQIFVWDSLVSAIPLTKVIQTQITVSN